MITVPARLTPTSQDGWPAEAFSAKEIGERLHYWREHLMEMKAGNSNPVLTMAEVRNSLDRWLDEMNELRGR